MYIPLIVTAWAPPLPLFTHQVEDTGRECSALIPSGALSVKQPLSSSSSSRSCLLGLRGGSRWKRGAVERVGAGEGWWVGRKEPNRCGGTAAVARHPGRGKKKAYHFWGPVPSPTPPTSPRAGAAPSLSATGGSSDTRGHPFLAPTVGGEKKTPGLPQIILFNTLLHLIFWSVIGR